MPLFRMAVLITIVAGMPASCFAQIVAGDRCLVVAEGAEVCRMQSVVDKLDKGQVVVAKAVQPASDGNWIKIDRANGDYGWVHEDNLSRDGLLGIRLDDVRKAVVIKEDPPIKMAAGTSKVVEDNIRVHHTVTISKRGKVESRAKVDSLASIPASVFGKFESAIRGEIEKSTGQQFGVESERKRSVTIQGGTSKCVKVTWLEYYRTGRATLLVNGEEHQAPFEFREDFGLVTEEVDLPQPSFEVVEAPPPAPKREATPVVAPRRDPRTFSWPEVALAFVVGAVAAFSLGRLSFRRKPDKSASPQP